MSLLSAIRCENCAKPVEPCRIALSYSSSTRSTSDRVFCPLSAWPLSSSSWLQCGEMHHARLQIVALLKTLGQATNPFASQRVAPGGPGPRSIAGTLIKASSMSRPPSYANLMSTTTGLLIYGLTLLAYRLHPSQWRSRKWATHVFAQRPYGKTFILEVGDLCSLEKHPTMVLEIFD